MFLCYICVTIEMLFLCLGTLSFYSLLLLGNNTTVNVVSFPNYFYLISLKSIVLDIKIATLVCYLGPYLLYLFIYLFIYLLFIYLFVCLFILIRYFPRLHFQCYPKGPPYPPPIPYPPTAPFWPWCSPVLGNIKFASPMGLSFQ